MFSFSVMGEKWVLRFAKEDDGFVDGGDGYCDPTTREIVIQDRTERSAGDVHDLTNYTLKVIRHEVIHAYLYECGLGDNSLSIDCWAKNEEMVDWFAIIGKKIATTWNELEIAYLGRKE